MNNNIIGRARPQPRPAAGLGALATIKPTRRTVWVPPANLLRNGAAVASNGLWRMIFSGGSARLQALLWPETTKNPAPDGNRYELSHNVASLQELSEVLPVILAAQVAKKIGKPDLSSKLRQIFSAAIEYVSDVKKMYCKGIKCEADLVESMSPWIEREFVKQWQHAGMKMTDFVAGESSRGEEAIFKRFRGEWPVGQSSAWQTRHQGQLFRTMSIVNG